MLIQQGVGFAEGPNAAGAILIIFCSFYWFVYRSYQRRAWLYAAVAILALFTTVSRSAIFSYCIIISIYLVIKIIRSILLKKISKHAASYAVSVVLVLAFLIAGGYGILSRTEGPRYIN